MTFQSDMWRNHVQSRPWDDPLRDLEWLTLAIGRDDGGELTAERREALLDELGDMLVYLALIAQELGVTPGELVSRSCQWASVVQDAATEV